MHEVYWEAPSGVTSARGFGGREGQREKRICDAFATEDSGEQRVVL